MQAKPHRALPLCVAALGLLLAGSFPGVASAQQKPKQKKPVTHTVTLDAVGYKPAKLTIAPGDSIVWINRDLIPHTATSSAKKEKGGFDSGVIAAGKSWKYTPKGTGTFDYICSFHPTMKGTLTIKK